MPPYSPWVPPWDRAGRKVAEVPKKVGGPTEGVGDDLTVTNVTRVKKAIGEKACSTLLLKVNRIRTVTESIHAF